MPEIPECLNRRYKALDQLIKELSAMPNHRTTENHSANKYTHEPGIKLMCDFWKILKEDPGCDLRQAVKEQMGLNAHAACSSFPNEVACYMAGRTKDNPKPDGCEWHSGKNRGQDNPGDDGKNAMDRIRRLYCESHCANREKKDSTESVKKSSEMPLTKALCCLKEAASLDKKCNLQVMELMEAQKELKDQIESLEQREKEGTELINQADGMWITMEEEYKEKIAQSLEKQKEMVKKLKEVEASNSKWRRNKKELEDQIKSVNKSLQDLADKISRKNNDIKCIELEIGEFTKRVNNNKRAEETGKQNLINKRTAFDKKMAGYNANIVTLTNELAFLQNQRKDKETEGSKVVRDAREDTQKICRLLLQKRMENEELIVENEGILKEIELLKQTCDQCKDKCSTKRNNLDEEIKKVDKEIADYKYQCVRCHQCTDTEDARRLCSDCPRCKETRECTTVGDHCERDASYDCVCVHVKEKFLNNVFENMYTVLERQSRSKPGKVLAESIVKSLNNSRNGKLDGETRRLVQDFVLNSVRKNLNLTIVGGAVKTRCELDPKTYGQLMSCLTSVKVVEPPKEDKGTEAKKDSCRRWGGSQECNCPGGAKECICIQRAPPPLHKEPTPYPTIPEKDEDSSQNPKNAKVRCPRKEPETCGSNCGATVKEENAEETCNTKPNKICETNECPFKRIVRSSQCGIGPESLASEPNTYIAAVPCMPTASGLEYKKSCKCGGINPKTCKCGKDKTRPRERIIGEVMGKYSDVTSNQNVYLPGGRLRDENYTKKDKLRRRLLKVANNRTSAVCDRSSDVILIEGTDALIEMLLKKNKTHVCKTIWNKVTNGSVKLSPKEESTNYPRNSNTGVQVILHPRFRAHNEKCDDKPRPPEIYSKNSLNSNCSKISKNRENVSRKAFSKNSSYLNEEMGGNVRELLDNIIKLDTDERSNNSNTDIRWMSVDSLIQLISSKIIKTEHKNSITTCYEEPPISPKHEKICNLIKKNFEMPRQHKSRLPKITKTINSSSNCFLSRGDERKNIDKSLKKQNNEFQDNFVLSQRTKSKLIERPANEYKSWKYFQQVMTEQSSIYTHNSKLNNRNSYQNNVAKINTNKCNIKPKMKQNMKNKNTPEIVKTTNFMTWLQNKTIKRSQSNTINYKRNWRKQRSKTSRPDNYKRNTTKDKSKLRDSKVYEKKITKYKPRNSISDNYKISSINIKLKSIDSNNYTRNTIKHKSINSDIYRTNSKNCKPNSSNSDNYKINSIKHKLKLSDSDIYKGNSIKQKPKSINTDNCRRHSIKGKPKTNNLDSYKRNSLKQKSKYIYSDSLIRNPLKRRPKSSGKRNLIKNKPNTNKYTRNSIEGKTKTNTSDNSKINPLKHKSKLSFSDSLIRNPINNHPKSNISDNGKRNSTKNKPNSSYSDTLKRNPLKHKKESDAKQLKAGLITNSTSTNDDNKFSNEDLKLFYKDENVENINKRKPILPSMSQQANALAESVFEEPNEACAKSKGSVNDEGTLSGTSGLEINNKLLDLIDKQYKENPDISVNLKNIDSDKPGSEYIKDNYKIKISKTPSGNRLFKITKTVTKSAPQDVVKTEPKSVNTAINYDDTSEISIMYSNDKLWAIDDMKSELQQKYANDEPIYIVLRTESRTFKIKSPVKKTLSGNIAVDIKKLGNNLKVQHSEGVIVLTRSDSGAIIINESVDGNGNAVIRNTASGAFLMVLIDSSKRTCSKEEPLKDKYFKVKIKSDDFDLDDPPAVLKSTPSQNYIFVPDKEYESRYKRAVNDTLDSSAEYYVNLTKTDSENCVLRVDDSWDDIKPNAVVVKSNSGDIKIINRKSTFLSLPPEQKRISDTSSSKALSNIINNVPNKVSTNSRRSSDYSKRSITSHKSCSESNIYQKVKLFYSDPKNFPAEPSPVLKMMSPGEYAVILGKESKISFIKNLKSYLENNFQGLVPIKRTDSGEVTIALNAEHTNKNDYGSLKITPSGNLYVIVDKELIAGMCEEEEDFLSTSTERATVNDVASRHIIRKLQHPVNRGVSTTCHGMPTSDCNKPLCVCSDIEFDIDNINWIYNDKNVKTINYFASAICGINWRRATSNIYPITVPYDKSAESLDNTTVSGIKELPHIIIKPFIDESLTNSFETKQQHCFSVIETVCPFKENSETTWEKIRARQNAEMNSSWDSLSFLPPQLPQFLKDVKY